MLRKSFCLSLLVTASPAVAYGSPVSQCLAYINTPKAKLAIACGGVIATIVLTKKCFTMYSAYQEKCKVAETARKVAEAKKIMSDAPARIEKIESAAQASLQEDLSAKVDCPNSPLVVRNVYRGFIAEARGLSDSLSKSKELLATQGESASIDNYVTRLMACETSLKEKLAELFKLPGFQVALQEELSQRMDDLSGRMCSFEYRVSQIQNLASRVSQLENNSNGYRVFQLENQVRQLQARPF